MRILFFAHLKEVTKCDFVELDLQSTLDAAGLWVQLVKQFPGLAAHRASVRLAKNGEYAVAEPEFSNDDEVALIPPVSGG